MTNVYEFSEYERDNLVYHFATLTPEESEIKKQNYAKLEAEKAAQKARQFSFTRFENLHEQAYGRGRIATPDGK